MKYYLTTALLIVMGSINGCSSLGPDYNEPTVDIEKQWLNDTDNKQTSTDPVQVKWWEEAFHDETLNSLIETMLNENLSLRSAGLRVLQSKQKLAIAIGSQYPQSQSLQGSAQSGAPFSSSAVQHYNLGFNLSWEADVWGRFQRKIESASANLETSVADYDGIALVHDYNISDGSIFGVRKCEK